LKKQNGGSEDFWIVGYSVGLISNMTVVPNFVIQPGLHLLSKGGVTSEQVYRDRHVYLKYTAIEMPVNFLYHTEGFSIGAGPSISLNVSGRVHMIPYPYEEKISFPISIGNSNSDRLKAFDFGVNAMVSYETKIGLQFIGNYNHGFTNLIPGDPSRTEMQSHYMALRVAYIFYRNHGKN